MPTPSVTLVVGIPLLSLALLWRLRRFIDTFGNFNHLPIYSALVSPLYPLGRTLPRIPWVTAGPTFGWRDAYECKSPSIGVVALR